MEHGVSAFDGVAGRAREFVAGVAVRVAEDGEHTADWDGGDKGAATARGWEERTSEVGVSERGGKSGRAR
ncbi:hypothetical protein GCM10009066_08090 [Halarchaeum salinum]|uniref:Uncharacterized protein n=1 Tax=Halarchaeum salinum TaxID=489912 RepID=A0AAV3S544_9EURY